MSFLPESGHDDRQLVRYLLRLLPDEDAERLDELSIADDEMAWRLRVVENDLVDAYVSGALTGEMLDRFESFYLSSERRRQKVRFAGSFLGVVDRGARRGDAEVRRDSLRRPAAAPAPAPARRSATMGRFVPRAEPIWTVAAAAAVLLLACGALLLRDMRLRSQLSQTQTESAALDRRAHQLEQQLSDQRAANAAAVNELERVRGSIAVGPSAAGGPPDRTGSSSQALSTIGILLLPQTRAVGTVATLAVPHGTDRVTFELRLESNRFPRYQVALRDPATNRVVWRSGRLTASDGDHAAVLVSVPARVLTPQHYSLELIGYGADGAAQGVASYAVGIASQ